MQLNYPIFCSSVLRTRSDYHRRWNRLGRMSTSSNKVIELRQFDYKGVPVIFVERSFFKIFLDERGLEWDVGLFLKRYMNPD